MNKKRNGINSKMASLIKDGYGEGYYGSLVEAFDPKTGKLVGHEPIVGMALRVGTLTAGMFSDRDWWMTTPIIEIISETEDEIRFKTANSTYTFRR